ncbi:MAG: hypothetical protein SCALA702_14360 [Melioribacteraceae bacterium]|nr:MAG: hypothetical protein SCALA702_14360 [Melioribacteraceae bacterium]
MIKKTGLILLILVSIVVAQRSHPNLVLTGDAANEIKENIGEYPMMDKSVNLAKEFVENAMNSPMDVPMPKDAGGGYTHERHKQNYNEMYQAGLLYQITGEEQYAEFIKTMLYKYAEMYPGLGEHPEGKQQTPGRMFWQSLNETVWMLHTIQAYDCIYDWLSAEDRELFEKNIFRPMTKFFLEECTHEFDLIHNHGTWIVAAVGMAGLIMEDYDLVQKSLYGSKLDKKTGFMAQLDLLFSPDGYYTEGGYYVRYALWPFFIYAEVLHNNLPDLGIYKYRDSILKKALYSALQVTYTNGEFIPINDALKEKTWLSPELIFAVNFVYDHYENDDHLLSIAKLHNEVSLTGSGLAVVKGLAKNPNPPQFDWQSVQFTDGPDGKQGGVGILRHGTPDDQETMFFKYGTHGLSHGHYDKLTFLFYDQGREIIQDYGAARFLNVVQKWGGRYLPENKTYALLTVAHNTLVVDEKSQYNGKRKESEKHHSDRYLFNSENPDLQYVSAKENNAYKGVKMHRTIVMVNDEILLKPALIDVYRVESEKEHTYDMPFYYKGHFIYSNYEYTPFTDQLNKMGKANGYQHLWKTAEAEPKETGIFTWWNGNRFYSIVSNTDEKSKVFFTMIGAEDPDFNLRNDPGMMRRRVDDNFTFVNIVEPHGIFDPTKEFTKDSYSTFEELNVLKSDEDYSVVEIKGKKDIDWVLCIANSDPGNDTSHSVSIGENVFTWTGPLFLLKK